MAGPGLDQMNEVSLDKLAQTASQQVVAVAREQMEVARRELAGRARQAAPGVAMVGGGAALAVLASGTGTAGLILLLTRRPGAAAAALGVSGAYVGAGALMARAGLERIREVAPIRPEVEVQDEPKTDGSPAKRAKQSSAKATRSVKSSAKRARSTKSAASSARRTGKSAAAKAPRKAARRAKPS